MKFLLDHDVPDDLSYLLEQLGPDIILLRKVLPGDSSDEAVFQFAHDAGCILVTATGMIFCGSHLRNHIRLLDRAGETGLRNNVNFA